MVATNVSLAYVMQLLTAPGNEEKILALKTTGKLEERMDYLREKMYTTGISNAELGEVNEYLAVVGVINLAKLKIIAKKRGVAA